MLKSYLKIAWRNLVRHKGYTLINIAGLAVGVACCVLISIYVLDELSYDRCHAKSDRIFKMLAGDASFFAIFDVPLVADDPKAALLSKDFVKLVLLANLLAWPIAYFAMHKWLQNFAYRIDIGWWGFALVPLCGTLVIALVTVSTQAIRAALANPVESLRYE